MVANTLLALSALLLLGGARAHCEGGRGPEITAADPTVRDCHLQYGAQYGENIEIFCSFDDSRYLTMRRCYDVTEFEEREENVPIIVLNATTILTVLKPAIDIYSYTCTDSKSGCEQFFAIHLEPAMHVSSPRATVRMYGCTYGYFVPYGDDFQIIFTAPEYQTIHLYKGDAHIELNSDVVNDTSVAYSARADLTGEFYYLCLAPTGASDSTLTHTIYLTVDYFPEAHNFSCFKYDFKKKIECSWRSYSEEHNFKLFYKEKLLCFVMADGQKSTCEWKNIYTGRKLFNYANQNVSLVMQSCNDFICNNQTFTMHFSSIIKFGPVKKFYVKNTSTRDVVMSWENKACELFSPCIYKIEYRLLAFGETWRHATTSSVRCVPYGGCEFRLASLYPDTKYEVRVSCRHKEATDDRLWSDPASVSVVTKPREECACDASEGTSESTLDAACEACQLADHIDKKTKQLNKLKIISKKKLDRINRYIKVINELNSILSSY